MVGVISGSLSANPDGEYCVQNKLVWFAVSLV